MSMEARCTCTMEKVDERKWKKPMGGYKKPDPKCGKCKGRGFTPVSIPLEEIAAVWAGICSVCREQAHCHIQYQGTDAPTEDGLLFTVCPNGCKNSKITWEKARG